MKLAIHEIRATIAAIREDRLEPAFKMLSRVARIFEQLTGAWDVLQDHDAQRIHRVPRIARPVVRLPVLAVPRDRIPGRQPQPRHAEARMRTGRRSSRSWRKSSPRRASTTRRCCCFRATASTSAKRRSARTGARRAAKTRRCWKRGRSSTRDPEKHWKLYELAEKLVDFEDYFRRWRFNHVTTVERIIGLKRGTGGTAGVSYLRKMLDVELFPELWKVRTEL